MKIIGEIRELKRNKMRQWEKKRKENQGCLVLGFIHFSTMSTVRAMLPCLSCCTCVILELYHAVISPSFHLKFLLLKKEPSFYIRNK